MGNVWAEFHLGANFIFHVDAGSGLDEVEAVVAEAAQTKELAEGDDQELRELAVQS